MKNKIYFVLLLLLIGNSLYAIEQRNYLQQAVQQVNDSDLLMSDFKPFPTYDNRIFWESLPPHVKAKFIETAEKSTNYVYGTVSLTSYLDFVRTGSRASNEKFLRERNDNLRNLILGELWEGKGRFLDNIVDASWSVCEQTYWGVSAHLVVNKEGRGVPDIKKPVIDLVAGEIANTLSWAYYFFKPQMDAVSPIISRRIKEEVANKIIDPYITRNDYWWQASKPGAFVNNWNPWCNFNVLTATLLTSNDKETNLKVLKKSMKSVDQFINYYKSDGGCEEGATYWDHAAGKMLEYLELVNFATAGKVNILNQDLIRKMGRYIALSYIGENYYMNFEDAQAINSGFSDIVYRYGVETRDEQLRQFGAYLEAMKKDSTITNGSLDRILHQLFIYKEIRETKGKPLLSGFFWLDGVQHAATRSQEGSNKGFYLAVKGGHNGESHNHNDVGTFILYYNGDPVLIDAGVGTYTAKTFSSRRYELWHTQSSFHNLPQINGIQQKDGPEYKASNVTCTNNANTFRFSVNIAGAYPKEAACKSWIRSYQLNKKKDLTITDGYVLDSIKAPNELNFLIAKGVEEMGNGKLLLKGNKESLILSYPTERFVHKIEKIELDDPRFSRVWGATLFRLILTDRNPALKSTYQLKVSKL